MSHNEKFGFLLNFFETSKEKLKMQSVGLEKHLTLNANRDILME